MEKTSFKQWLELQNLSSRTIREYSRYQGILRQSRKWNQQTIDTFLLDHNNNVARAFVRKYKQYLLRDDKHNPDINKVDIPQMKRNKPKQPDTISKRQVKRIFRYLDMPFRIILLLSYYGSLRVDEVMNLMGSDVLSERWEDNQEKMGVVRLIGKGGEKDYVFVPPMVMRHIVNYIIDEKIGREQRLFTMTGKHWRVKLSDASNSAIGRHVNPHLLRHSYATYLIENGWDISLIKEHLRHKDISSTQIYAKVSKKLLQEKHMQLNKV